MPLKRCGEDGYKWGDAGKCYTGPDAKKKAIKQGIAIEGPKKFSEKASEEGICLSQEEISLVSDHMYENNYSLAAIVSVTTSLASHDYEEVTEDNFYVPEESDYFSVGDEEEEWDWAADRPGLWENIRRKKMREGDNYKPAKKGDKDRPDPEAWKRAQSKELQKDVYDNPGEAMKRAKELGLDGIHDHPSKKDPDKKVYMPGKTHDEYEKALREEMSKAKFAYKDPFTGEMFYFERPGVYKKNGRMLVRAEKAEAYGLPKEVVERELKKEHAEVEPIVEEKKKGKKHTSFIGKQQVTAPPTITWEKGAEYQGRKVTLNKPFRTPDGPKKSAVYVMGPKGKVVIVRFGDPNMKIKKSDPARRKSFRARHNCDNPGPKWKARYWSCKAW